MRANDKIYNKIAVIGDESDREEKDKAIDAFKNAGWAVSDISKLETDTTSIVTINPIYYINNANLIYLVAKDGSTNFDSVCYCCYAQFFLVPVFSSELVIGQFEEVNKLICGQKSIEEIIKLDLVATEKEPIKLADLTCSPHLQIAAEQAYSAFSISINNGTQQVKFQDLPSQVQKAWQEACKKIIILAEEFLSLNKKR